VISQTIEVYSMSMITVIIGVAALFCFVDASKCNSSFGCISSLTQDYCEDIGQFLQPNLTMGGCCPGCMKGVSKYVTYGILIHTSFSYILGKCASCRGPRSVCAPGLSCNMEFKCVLNESKPLTNR
jgi:hypothetical protein